MSDGRPVGSIGYLRPDGPVGARNHVLVLSIVGLVNRPAARMAAEVSGTVLVATPYGRGQYATDAGNSYCSALAPTVKISGRSETAPRLAGQIDPDASTVFEGRKNLGATGARLLELTLEAPSGALISDEVHAEGAEAFTRAHASM